MPQRSYTAPGAGYRYGFNGKENDNEVKGEGNQQDYGMRIYDPRVGRFLSVDALSMSYPFYSTYQFAGNTPIWAFDIDGNEPGIDFGVTLAIWWGVFKAKVRGEVHAAARLGTQKSGEIPEQYRNSVDPVTTAAIKKKATIDDANKTVQHFTRYYEIANNAGGFIIPEAAFVNAMVDFYKGDYTSGAVNLITLGIGAKFKGAMYAYEGLIQEARTAATFTNAGHNAAEFQKLLNFYKAAEDANPVVESLVKTGKLPSNYVVKKTAEEAGWKGGKALNNFIEGAQMGGDKFQNPTLIKGLPLKQGRNWFEADIGISNTMSRSKQPGNRLLYSDDGLMYITTDHYESATYLGKFTPQPK